MNMKTFLKWSMVVVAASVSGTVLARAIQAGRRGVKGALKQAESVADKTKDVLSQTESTLWTVHRKIDSGVGSS